MKPKLLLKFILPFLIWYGLLIVFTLAIDFILHYFKLVYVGRYLGSIGSLLILLSFIYSLRKRKFITGGSPKQLLLFHEYIAWIGSGLLLVHAGIHFNALLPWLATFVLMLVVALGLVGKFLLKDASASLAENRQQLRASGWSEKDVEKKLFFDSITLDVMKQWRVIHLPIALLFACLALLHILSILIFKS